MGCASSAPLAPGSQTGVLNDAPPFDKKLEGESGLTSRLRQNAQDIVGADHILRVMDDADDTVRDAGNMVTDVGEGMKEKVFDTLAEAEETVSSTFSNFTSTVGDKVDQTKEIIDDAEEKIGETKNEVDALVEDLERALPSNSPLPEESKSDFQKDNCGSAMEEPQVDSIGVVITEIEFKEQESSRTDTDLFYNFQKITEESNTVRLKTPTISLHDDVIGSPPPLQRSTTALDQSTSYKSDVLDDQANTNCSVCKIISSNEESVATENVNNIDLTDRIIDVDIGNAINQIEPPVLPQQSISVDNRDDITSNDERIVIEKMEVEKLTQSSTTLPESDLNEVYMDIENSIDLHENQREGLTDAIVVPLREQVDIVSNCNDTHENSNNSNERSDNPEEGIDLNTTDVCEKVHIDNDHHIEKNLNNNICIASSNVEVVTDDNADKLDLTATIDNKKSITENDNSDKECDSVGHIDNNDSNLPEENPTAEDVAEQYS